MKKMSIALCLIASMAFYSANAQQNPTCQLAVKATSTVDKAENSCCAAEGKQCSSQKEGECCGKCDKSYQLMETPAVANDKILETIIAQHAGKPVFVDFWATWCGPCIRAMETLKPFKPEMKENGVVTIYITGESSPKEKWEPMLDDMGGIHYYLTADQWKAVCEQYEIRGIPNYIIFDKTGAKSFQTAGFPGVDKMREEMSKVW